VVSAPREADFDLGMRVNLGGMRAVLDQVRRCVSPPRLVFASSVAAFGGDLPDVLDDSTTPVPQTSYGSQKVVSEYLVADSRARASSTRGRCACRPSWCARAKQTPRPRLSRARWCASR